MAARLVLCATDDVADGTAFQVAVDDLDLAVFNVDGAFHVTDNQCTHGPGLLAEGYIEGRTVECDFHGGQFDIVTGEVLAPPCMLPVTIYRTAVEGGKVVIDVD